MCKGLFFIFIFFLEGCFFSQTVPAQNIVGVLSKIIENEFMSMDQVNMTNNSNSVDCSNMAVDSRFNFKGYDYVVVSDKTIKNQVNLQKLTDGHVRFCTSHVIDMTDLFSGNIYFNQDISDWDVSNVTNMSYMFNGLVDFDQDISDWDVSSVFNFNNMFSGALSFSHSLSSWEANGIFSKEAMKDMFFETNYYCNNIIDWIDELDFFSDIKDLREVTSCI